MYQILISIFIVGSPSGSYSSSSESEADAEVPRRTPSATSFGSGSGSSSSFSSSSEQDVDITGSPGTTTPIVGVEVPVVGPLVFATLVHIPEEVLPVEDVPVESVVPIALDSSTALLPRGFFY